MVPWGFFTPSLVPHQFPQTSVVSVNVSLHPSALFRAVTAALQQPHAGAGRARPH